MKTYGPAGSVDRLRWFLALLVVLSTVLSLTGIFVATELAGRRRPAAALVAPLPSAGSSEQATGEVVPPDEPAAGIPSGPPAAILGAASCDPASVPSAATPTGPSVQTVHRLTLHVPILMYHRIVPFAQAGHSLHGLVVPPSLFASQMDALRRAGWRTITLETLAQDLAAGRQPDPKTFVVTFDDGYDDGFTYALPVLQANGFTATYFVIPGRIGDPADLTPDHLRALVAAGDEIGDHSMDHVDLTILRPDRLRYEIDAAAQKIALLTGRWPRTFAYPFGAVNARVVDAVSRCGPMLMAVTTAPGATEGWTNRFLEPRVRVGPSTTPVALVRELESDILAPPAGGASNAGPSPAIGGRSSLPTGGH